MVVASPAVLPVPSPHRARGSVPSPPGVVGRSAERARIDVFVDALPRAPRSLVLVGEAGIGKTTLWRYAVSRARAAGARVLVARPTEDDRHSPVQGLLDLVGQAELPDDVTAPLDPDLPLLDRSRLVLDLLRRLTADGPVVVAVDDLPWLDDVTRHVLRFALRRLADEPAVLLATARTWSPDVPAPLAPELDLRLDGALDRLEVPALPTGELRRVVLAAVPSVSATVAAQVGDLAHGNPLFAIELARDRHGPAIGVPAGSPLAALGRRVADLPPDTLRLARLLAVAGPSPVPTLGHAAGLAHPDDAVRAGVDADVFSLEPDFVLRFTHPLITTAVLGGTHPLDRRGLHAALAAAATDPDARAVHLARAVVGPDAEVAALVEETARRHARRGAPRLAADLFADSARLTPPDAVTLRVRRTIGQMMQCATAGDLPTALHVATSLLDELGPGPLRAEVVTGRVVIDFGGAEEFLRAALDHVPSDGSGEDELLRGRLLGTLGWLLAIHLGRVAEGLALSRAALEIGRTHADTVLVAQAASAVSTASLLLGRREDDLVAEACALGPEVVQSQLVLWPRVLRGRQRLWDGRLTDAAADLDRMYRDAVANGAEIQRPYRLADLALVTVAAGDLDTAATHVADGLESARDCGDERAQSWLAYPAGVVAALRAERDTAEWAADRLDWWADRVGERPRRAMALHVRGLLAAAGQDWAGGLALLGQALGVLDDLGYRHPGAIPVLPQAVQLATLAGDRTEAGALAARLERQVDGLGSPWATAQLRSAHGQLGLLDDAEGAAAALDDARGSLEALGYGLDAARTGTLAAAAALRAGRRRDARTLAEQADAVLSRAGVRGWDGMARDLLDRARGGVDDGLTATEEEIAAHVAVGRRNREIAGRLFVSESTVEAHLTRIYRKLGLRNRAELAQRVARGRDHPERTGEVPPGR